MATNLKFAVTLKNAMANAITTTVGGSATINLYNGTQPASPDTALSGQTLLATLTCNATFAPGASGGVLTLNSITDGTGTAGAGSGMVANFFRLTTSGSVAIIDGTVGISGCDLNINNTSIATGQDVSCTSATITMGN